MANIAGVRTTSNIQQARRVVDMAKNIALLDPNDSPFVTFLKLAKQDVRVAKAPKIEWLEDDLIGAATQVNAGGGVSITTSSTSIPVDDGSIFSVGDLISIPAKSLVYRITAISTNTLTAIQFGTSVASGTIADDSVVLKLGNAMEENSSAPAAKTTQEVACYNYTQIFRTPVSFSGTELATELYGGKDRAYQRRKKALEHKRDIARAMYFGVRKEDTTGTTPRRTMGGLLSFLTESTAFDSSTQPLTYANFNKYVAQPVFSHGSKDKLLIAGPNLMNAINAWSEAKLVTEVDPAATYGIRVKNLITGYGDLKVIYDPLLADGYHAGYGMVIDTDNIRYAYLQGRDTKLNTNIQANDVDGVIDEYITECSLEVKLPKTHLLITGAY